MNASDCTAGRLRRLPGPRLLAAMAAVWLGGVVLGFGALLRYEVEPGPEADVPVASRAELPVPLASDRPTLVLAIHPHCPCTRATMGELERVLARAPSHPAVEVLVFADPDQGPEWTETDLTRRAAALPGARVHLDPDGAGAARLGATTSGHVVLFAHDGHRLFQGGITTSRGHEGDNAGSAALVAWLGGGVASDRLARNHTFGCALGAPATAPAPVIEEEHP